MGVTPRATNDSGFDTGLVVLRGIVSIVAVSLGISLVMLPGAAPWTAAAILPMTLGYGLLVGLPAAFAIRAWRGGGVLSAATAGAAVGALPGGIAALSEGPVTLFFLTALGVGSAVAAWLLVQIQKAPQRLLPDRFSTLASLAGTAAVAVAAVVGFYGGEQLIFGPKDTSCHNLFRDGRKSISPVASASMEMSVADWIELRRLLTVAGGEGNWSVQDLTHQTQDVDQLYVSLCREPGTVLQAQQMVWPEHNPPGGFERRVNLMVYQPQGGTDWVAPARSVLQRVSAAWPGRLTFHASDGGLVPPPAWYCAAGAAADSALCRPSHP
jgi:hypothetical protein